MSLTLAGRQGASIGRGATSAPFAFWRTLGLVKVFHAPKIERKGCAVTITRALDGVAGVTATRVGVAGKEVEVDPVVFDEDRMRRVLAEARFPPV